MEKLKLVLVGYGNIAKKHLEVFNSLDTYFSASCNRSKEKREEAKKLWNIPNNYIEPEEMVEKEKPDGILITTSFTENYKITKKLLKYGIPILLEKPPALSLKEVKDLIKLSEKYNTKVMIGFNRRFYSIYHKFLEEFGGKNNISFVCVEWSEDPFSLLSAGVEKDLISKYVYANSLHGIDLILFFLDSLIKYRSWGRNISKKKGKLLWQMGFEGENKNKSKAFFYSNWAVPGRWRLLVDFNEARVICSPLEITNILSRNKKIQIESSIEDKNFKPGFYGQARHFINIIKNNEEINWPACSLKDSEKSIKIAEDLTLKCLKKKLE